MAPKPYSTMKDKLRSETMAATLMRAREKTPRNRFEGFMGAPGLYRENHYSVFNHKMITYAIYIQICGYSNQISRLPITKSLATAAPHSLPGRKIARPQSPPTPRVII